MLFNAVTAVYGEEEEMEWERQKPHSHHHHPSGACAYVGGKFAGTCRKAMWYDWNNWKKTNPPDAPALFKMSVGDRIHLHLGEVLERWLDRRGVALEGVAGDGIGQEVPFFWQCPDLVYPFSGRMDGRYYWKGTSRLDGRYFGVEWKSIYGRGSTQVKKDGVKTDALLQCAIYLEQDFYPIDEIEVLYVCRDSGYFLGYSVRKGDGGFLEFESMASGKKTVTEVRFADIVLAYREFENSLEEGSLGIQDYGLPESDPKDAWRCSYCSWSSLCRGEA